MPPAIPSSPSSLREEGGHTVVFWVGVALATLFGIVLALLGVLLLFKYISKRRPNSLWGDDFFDPTLDAAASAVISGRTVTSSEKPAVTLYPGAPMPPDAMAPTSNSLETSHPPWERNADAVSETEGWPPKTLLASEFDGERTLQPPQPLRIANHVHGDYSSDERSTLAPPKRSFSDGVNDDELGTPRPPQAAPFLRPSLRDGGLPVPWSDVPNHLAVPTPLSRSQSVPGAAELSRHTSRASRTSFMWWAEEGRPSSTLPADGWAATLRSNLYATLGALSLRDNSDPGAGAFVDPFTRQPSRRSRTSLHRSGAGGLHRADTEGSKYSQASAGLSNPFADPTLPSGVDKGRGWAINDCVGLGLQSKSDQDDFGPLKQTRSSTPVSTIDVAGIHKRSAGNASSLDEERASRVEKWLARHKASEEPMRTLWPSASGRDAGTSGGGSRGSGRPLVRRRGSSHVGGYTSED